MKTTIFAMVLVLVLPGLLSADIYSLIAHWEFDETSGSTAYDSSGNDHNGTVVGNPAWTAGRINGCLDFDGNSDYVDFGDIDELEFGNNDFTVAFWFYTEGPHNAGGDQGSYGSIVGKYNWGLGRQWWFQQMPDGKIRFATYPTGTKGECTDSQNGYQGQWVHCVGVRDGQNKYLYINGALDANGPCHGLTTGKSTKVLVGAVQDPGKYYQFFNGKIDDVRIYNYALDVNEVAQLYDEGAPELTGLQITGPNSVAEETQSVYQVFADYDNGSSKNVTAEANLAVDPDEFAEMDPGGILETFRLYRPQETCTIYADYMGFAAEKPVTIYPVCDSNECTDEQLLERNIADVIEIKQDVMDDLDYAMKVERASLQLLGQTLKDKHCKGFQRGQLNKARIKILSALIWETWANKKIGSSIDSLEDAAELLLSEKPGNGPKK